MTNRLQLSPVGDNRTVSVPVNQWSRNFALFGEANEGSFLYDGDDPATVKSAQTNWLFADVREGSQWRGFVNSTTLVYPSSLANEAYMYSLSPSGNAPLFNRVGGYSKSAAAFASVVTDDDSIDRYGTHETIVYVEGDATARDAARDALLAEASQPRLQIVNIPARVDSLALHVGLLGYLYTALWEAADNSATDKTISGWIKYWIGLCPHLSEGAIANNTTTIDQPNASIETNRKSCYHGFQEMLTYPDHNDNKMRLWVDVGNNVHYQPLDSAERFFMRGGSYYDNQSGQRIEDAGKLRAGYIANKDTGVTVLYEKIGFKTTTDGTRQVTTNVGSDLARLL